ncbi:CBASS oligonucleotide cyclase [Sorangium sp. So ce295]|jgi:hypothetical protein|uniref:CBASS oligonucleotide cyclase n=1 Tax=Sorangium sp. So ce295 TaxID=3133295 RepID=UPI003F60B99D
MAGGGGGGGRYSRPSPSLEAKIAEVRARERQRLDQEIAQLLAHYLLKVNARDRELTRQRLDAIEQALGERVQLDRILFGGSVAKHTEVDGISDVDALVILDREDLRGASAQKVKEAFFRAVEEHLPRAGVSSIRLGQMAVTVTYDDGMEIQLVPAIRKGTAVAVPSASSGGWTQTEPGAFRRRLTDANARLGGNLVPAIKLVKAILSRFPEQKRLSGYHIEALAVDAANNYAGSTAPKDLVLYLIDRASERVLRPVRDTTGQSRNIDAHLGAADSAERRNIALALDGMRRRLSTATTVAEWKAVLEE